MANGITGSGILGSFGEEEYRSLKNSSIASQRQTYFQPRAGSPSRQLKEDMMFPKDEEQGCLGELSPPPPNKLNKTTNIQSAMAYTVENLAWQTARQDKHIAQHMEQINARFDELFKLVATGSSKIPPTFIKEQLQTARSLQARRSTRSPQQQQQ